MKKIVAMMMVCVMAFTCIPGSAFAASVRSVDSGKTVVYNQQAKATAKAPAKKPVKLNHKKLKNGTYKVSGRMLKVDRKTPSMADKAFNKNFVLTVKDGKYYVTLDLKGLKVGNKFGYLGKLFYYGNDYKKDKFGNPKGKKTLAQVLTYQKKNGKIVKDKYAKKYPDKVKFRVIPKAINDGFVPLQVVVPLMESFGKGLGTQQMYLKINWNTLKK